MRTKGNIALNPLQILNCAKNFGRLYDIEKATLKNTLKYLSKHQLDFENRRLYINSISSHALDDKDFMRSSMTMANFLKRSLSK